MDALSLPTVRSSTTLSWSQQAAPENVWTISDVMQALGWRDRPACWKAIHRAGVIPQMRSQPFPRPLPGGGVGHPRRKFAVLTDAQVAQLAAYRLRGPQRKPSKRA